MGEAHQSAELFSAMCAEPMGRVPGMATSVRLAVRIANGRTPQEAAAREYVYRWGLALQSWRCFGAPHALGL